MSLLSRSGLWRLTRHEVVRDLYQRLDEVGLFLAQLDRFERPVTESDRVPNAGRESTPIDVRPVTDWRPSRLRDTPLAPSDRLVVAQRAGTPVGWCCLSDRPIYVPELHRRLTVPGSYLWRLYVTPSERGQGIGTAIVRRALEHTRVEMDAVRMTALVAPDNVPSRNAFLGLGFEPTTRYTSVGYRNRTWHRQTTIE